MPGQCVNVNRAPVLTLWSAVVAERLGFEWNEALSLGKAVAGLNAQAKGRTLGLFKVRAAGEIGKGRRRGEEFWIEICGRPVPAKQTEEGVRAVVLDKPIDPGKVDEYLHQKFGEDLKVVRDAMVALARGYDPESLAEAAFALYEKFHPQIPAGKAGWGAKGTLDLGLVRSLARGA